MMPRKNGSAETLSFAAPDIYILLVDSGATLLSSIGSWELTGH